MLIADLIQKLRMIQATVGNVTVYVEHEDEEGEVCKSQLTVCRLEVDYAKDGTAHVTVG